MSLIIQLVHARIICILLEVLIGFMVPGGCGHPDDPILLDPPVLLLCTCLTLQAQHHLVPLFLLLDCLELLHEFALQGGTDLGHRWLRSVAHFNLYLVLAKGGGGIVPHSGIGLDLVGLLS